MMAELVDSFIEYCQRDTTRDTLLNKLVDPAMSFLEKRYRWCVQALQLLLVLAVLQTLALAVILVRVVRASPA